MGDDVRAVRPAVERPTVEPAEQLADGPRAQITYYGRLGEMGHPEDRADDWPPCDPGTRGGPMTLGIVRGGQPPTSATPAPKSAGFAPPPAAIVVPPVYRPRGER